MQRHGTNTAPARATYINALRTGRGSSIASSCLNENCYSVLSLSVCASGKQINQAGSNQYRLYRVLSNQTREVRRDTSKIFLL
jgi:hypothetical protein